MYALLHLNRQFGRPEMKFSFHHYHHLDPALERRFFELLINQKEQIMTKVQETADRMEALFAEQKAGLEDIQGDIKFLTDKIAEIQNSPGTLSPEDQAALDAMEAKAAEVTNNIKTLASQTPPAA